jgi:hypothetical protein
MVRKAARIYRLWWRSHAPAASTFDEYRVPDDDAVARAAVRLADNLRVSTRGAARWGDGDYPGRQERLAALEWRESIRDLGE